MFTPKSVIYPCSSNPDEILVSGEDEHGRPVNAPIIIDAALAKQLAATPTTIPNPAHQPLVDMMFARAHHSIAASATLMDAVTPSTPAVSAPPLTEPRFPP